MVAGLGCRRDASADEILVAMRRAVDAAGVTLAGIDAVATADFKAGEAGVRSAAQTLGVPLVVCPRADLDRVGDRTITRSEMVAAAVGLPSVAEAAALVAAGRNARLLGPRVATATATCALAIGDGP
ncbi:cobalamin biosynthesis protein [Rhodoplanes roseus]|nr:cobalamin biosynthesis protein [Rhodoplanes roseus]